MIIRPTFVERHGISPLLFGFVTLILIFLLYQIIGGVVTIVLFGLKPSQETITGYRYATGVSQVLLILLPAFFLTRLISRSPILYLRLRVPEPQLLLYPLFGMLSLQQILQMYLKLQEKIPFPKAVQEFIDEFKALYEEVYKMLVSSASVPELLFVILVLAVVPAFAEECLFRGLVQRSFEKGLTPVKGMVLTGIIFGAYHLNPFTFIPLAVLGIYLGFLTLRSDSLWVSIAAHFYNNAIAAVATYFHLDEDALITGKPEEMSAELLIGTLVVSLIIFAVSTTLFIRATKNIQPQTLDTGDMLSTDNNYTKNLLPSTEIPKSSIDGKDV